ncbi:MAG: hypothetical protein QW177_07025 [Candidatus Nitrosotenuis sp.]
MRNNKYCIVVAITAIFVGIITTPIASSGQENSNDFSAYAQSMDHSGMSMKKDSSKTEMKDSMKKEDKTKMSSKSTATKEGYKLASKTVTSTKDPGVGHETHQLAIILPPSNKVYHGILTYSASEPVQLVSLTGPLKAGEDKGQPVWSDGKNKFALTFIDPITSAGSWQFSGNALAIHTKNKDPFTVSYSVAYKESAKTDLTASKTVTSTKDPGVGHETHQLAIILPPSNKVYHGILTYSASESIQLVSLTGPLKAGEDKGQPTWTPDGKTKFALTLIDPGNSAGSWKFSGNAIAVHTRNADPFTVSYSLVAAN